MMMTKSNDIKPLNLTAEEKRMWRRPRAYAISLFKFKGTAVNEVSNIATAVSLGEGKRPRHYSAEILAAKTLQERRRLLSEVPEKYREWVEILVRNAFEKKAKKGR